MILIEISEKNEKQIINSHGKCIRCERYYSLSCFYDLPKLYDLPPQTQYIGSMCKGCVNILIGKEYEY
jgi:hypothetical protein